MILPATATTHTLETYVYRLRQKLEADPRQPRLLLTERSGYKLDVAVFRAEGR